MGEFKFEDLREKELVGLGPCAVCGKKLFEGATSGLVPFYIVTVSMAMTNPDSLRRRVGLGMQIGDQLAQVMGADEPLAKAMPPTKFLMHQKCTLEMVGLMEAVETTNNRNSETEAAE